MQRFRSAPRGSLCTTRSVVAVLSLVLLTLSTLADAAPYSGGQCNDVLPFQISDSADFVQLMTAEGTVDAILEGQAVWTTEECARAMRKTACMISYFQLADMSGGPVLYCSGTCESDLAPCKKYFDIAQEAEDFWSYMCGQLPANNVYGPLCVEGNEPAQYEEDQPICPKPLATYSDEDLDYEYGYVLKIDGTQCAVPCPSIVFELDDLDAAWDYTFVLNIISTVMASITTIIYTKDRKWLIAHFAAGNAVNSFTQLITMGLDYDQDWLCRGDNKVIYNRYHPWCVFQGFIATFAVVWIATWASIMAFQLYISVFTMQKKLLEKYFKYYMLAGWLIPSICMIPIAAQNEFGYDEELVIPICLVLQREDDTSFWVFMFLPWMLGVLVCIILMGTASYQLLAMTGACRTPTWNCFRTRTVETDEEMDKRKQLRLTAWKRSLSFNRRTTIFILVFGVFSLLTAFCALYCLYFNRPLFRGGVTDFVKCLLKKATSDPNAAKQICGDTSDPAPPFWMAAEMDIFWSAYGCVPFIVYGTAGKLQLLWSQPIAVETRSRVSSYFGRMWNGTNSSGREDSSPPEKGRPLSVRRVRSSSTSFGAPASSASSDHNVSTHRASGIELVASENSRDEA